MKKPDYEDRARRYEQAMRIAIAHLGGPTGHSVAYYLAQTLSESDTLLVVVSKPAKEGKA